MSQAILKQGMNVHTNVEATDPGWKSLYTIGGVAALLAVLAFLLDIVISFSGTDFNPAALSAVDWFRLFQANGLAGLRALGFINVISLTVSASLYAALYVVHRQRYQAYAALALLLYLAGATVYISNNAAVPMLVLSDKYAAATTEFQRTVLAGAGEAILVRGADFVPGSFIGFFFTEMAGLAFSLMMLRGNTFGNATAVAGIAGFALLTIFTVWITFVPLYFDLAMIVATLGGLASVAWYILVARKLFQQGRLASSQR